MFQRFANWFWSEDIWLPPGMQWSALQSAVKLKLPEFSDLRLSLYYAFAFLIMRAVFEWFIARPLGYALGIRDGGSSLPHLFACVLRRCRNIWLAFNNGLINGYCCKTANDERSSSSNTVPEIIHVILHKTTLDKFSESW
ncbi:unnamed protein product [Soboliphyme baturini]|uniref:Bestrophin homolog n=1 Tax=Soboliphyme baturini TaxID=241478 RepID=A0A183J4W1_9BILA|nr:unnamed protein product [Soboliphyme baturini]